MPYQIKNGIIYSGNAVTLTQAQYDALTTAEKNNGTVYYIYDSDAMIEAQEVGLDGGNVETLAGSVATFETSPSTAVHAAGEYILYQAQLYKVTSAIAVGEDLTVGSNIEATNLGNELNAGLTETETQLTLHRYSQVVGQSIGSGGTLDVTTTIAVPADFDLHYMFSQQYAGHPSMIITNYFRNAGGFLAVTIKNTAQSSQTCASVYFKFLILNNTQVG